MKLRKLNAAKKPTLGISLPKALINAIGWVEGTELDVILEEGSLYLRKKEQGD